MTPIQKGHDLVAVLKGCKHLRLALPSTNMEPDWGVQSSFRRDPLFKNHECPSFFGRYLLKENQNRCAILEGPLTKHMGVSQNRGTPKSGWLSFLKNRRAHIHLKTSWAGAAPLATKHPATA